MPKLMGMMGSSGRRSSRRPGESAAHDHLLGAEDGIRTRDPHLGKKKVMLGVYTVRDLRLRTSAATFYPPNAPQSRQFVGWST